VIKKMAPIIARARKANPPMLRRLAALSLSSLACWRHRRRWWEEGAMSSAAEIPVHSSVAKYTYRCCAVTEENPSEKGTISRKAKSPWESHPQLVEQFDDLAVTALLFVFTVGLLLLFSAHLSNILRQGCCLRPFEGLQRAVSERGYPSAPIRAVLCRILDMNF
jgi:hypothetical protein